MRWLTKALRAAEKSDHRQSRHGAVVASRSACFAVSYNKRWEHAEARALKNKSFPGAVLFSARAGRRMSRPCPACWRAMQRAGIARVVYYDWNGNIVEEKVVP